MYINILNYNNFVMSKEKVEINQNIELDWPMFLWSEIREIYKNIKNYLKNILSK